ncbi:MAG: 2TM domain-containing protein [Flavisolibacter sp.]
MYHQAPEGKDPQLWHLAQRRTSFKRHLSIYLIINIFLWALWYFGSRHYSGSEIVDYDNGNIHDYRNYINYDRRAIPWPLWTTIGWGIGVAFHFMSAYVTTGIHSVDKEYDKLVENKNKQ